MRVRRLYFPALGDSPRYYTLLNSETQFHYLANVLRVKKGQLVELFDGQGIVGNGSVIDVAKQSIEIGISEINSAPLIFHLI